MPGPIRSLVRVLASVALLSLALVFTGAMAASGAGTWSANSDIDQGNEPESVSCPSADFCVAVDDAGNAITFNGSSWSSPSNFAVEDYDHLLSVSCPSASFCIAVDDSGDALTYNGSSWSSPTGIVADYTESVSCPSTTFCVVVTGSGHAYTYNGSTWSSPANIAGLSTLDSVSCPSAEFCTAVDEDGDAVTYISTPYPPAVTSVSPHTGPASGGTLITITGTGFVTGARVVIAQGDGSGTGAIAATSVDVVSSTTITADTGGGAKAGSFNLFVIDSGGTSAIDSGDLFTYG